MSPVLEGCMLGSGLRAQMYTQGIGRLWLVVHLERGCAPRRQGGGLVLLPQSHDADILGLASSACGRGAPLQTGTLCEANQASRWAG